MLANATLIQNIFPHNMVTRAGFVVTTVRARQRWLVTCRFITEINDGFNNSLGLASFRRPQAAVSVHC